MDVMFRFDGEVFVSVMNWLADVPPNTTLLKASPPPGVRVMVAATPFPLDPNTLE